MFSDFNCKTGYSTKYFILLKHIILKTDSSIIKYSSQGSFSVRWEHSGSVVECLTQDRGAAGLSLTSVTALCP